MKNLEVGQELIITVGARGSDCNIELNGETVPKIYKLTLDTQHSPMLKIWGYNYDEDGKLSVAPSIEDGEGNTTDCDAEKIMRQFSVSGELRVKLHTEYIVNEDNWIVPKV